MQEFVVPQTPEGIRQIWDMFVHEDTDDSDAFDYRAIESGYSYFIYGKKAFEIKNLKKGATFRISGDFLRFIFPEKTDIEDEKFYTVVPLGLDDFPQKLKNYKQYVFRNLITDTFACCSKYVECSDALTCLHPHDRTYNGCYYRRNLENGLIFYGKNRNADENGLFVNK